MKLLELIWEAAANLMLHKTRSLLAVLGVIFGVASVICMLSISEVARQDVVRRIERLGLNNVIVDSVKPEAVRRQENREQESSWIAEYGITRNDLQVLESNVAAIRQIVPMRILLHDVVANQNVADVTVVGTKPQYTDVMDHAVERGRFIRAVDEANLKAVCVLGYEAARELFPLKSPIGEVVKIGGQFFDVIGVMEKKGQMGSGGKFANPDKAAFVPFESSFSRFGNLQVRQGGGVSEATDIEVNRAVLQVADAMTLEPVSQLAENVLRRLHKKKDVSVTIPYTLLNERKQSERIFRWVMGSLAAISLLVGGIGIMNIMLANMAERKSEIGLRRALGATRSDIVSLFVSESLLLCLLGGALGVAVGLGLAKLIGSLASWTVVYQPWSIPLGIIVSLIVGLVFGTWPSIRAAQQDPVLALRSE